MTDPREPLGPELRSALRAIAELNDADMERLGSWFTTWVSRFGQTPRATGMKIKAPKRFDPPTT